MATTEIPADRAVVRKLRALGVDVSQLADEPLPDELWEVIANIIRGMWGKQTHWYAAAAMYGRFITVLKTGGSANELAEQFGAGRELAAILRQPEMRELVLAANLPGSLNRWLSHVLPRTRVARHEKLIIAGDLIDQCHAGLAAGQAAAEIATRVGEPRDVARRLHRETLKRRPRWRRALRAMNRFAATVSMLFAVAIGWLQYRYYAVHPVDNGDEVEQLDARAAAIPVDDRAWPLYAAGLAEIDMLPHELLLQRPQDPQKQQQQSQSGAAIYAACEAGPDHPAWPDAADYVARNRIAVDFFLKAAEKSRLGYIRRDPGNNAWLKKLNQGAVERTFQKRPRRELLLPEFAAFHHAGMLLAGSAYEAAATGDTIRAINCVAALASMAQHIWTEEELPIGRLRAMQLFDLATRTLSALLATHGDSWSDEELLRCLAALRSWNFHSQGDLLAVSRQWSRTQFAEMYASGGRFTREGLETLCVQPLKAPELAWLAGWLQTTTMTSTGMTNKLGMALVGPCVVPFVANRDDLLKEFDALTELYEADLLLLPTGVSGSDTANKKAQAWLESKATQLRFLPLLAVVHPAWLTGAIEGIWKKVAVRDGVLIGIACHVYRRRHDAWPDSVQALVPEVLDAAPIDPIDGQPLRLVFINNRPFIYSVGFDGKDATAGTPVNKLKEIDPRDWQLYPPLDPTAGAEPAN
jgi:hypothetical protein